MAVDGRLEGERPLMQRILVVEDDDNYWTLIRTVLELQSFLLERLPDGSSLDATVDRFDPQLVILDVMLPGEDGWTLCRRLRERSAVLPILFLTGADGSLSKVRGLEAGADDYLTKPFDGLELVARVRALLRRAGLATAPRLPTGPVEVDETRHEVRVQGIVVPLTKVEFDLMRALTSHPEAVLTRDQLALQVWGYEGEVADRTVDSHVRNLRRKLREVYPGELIHSVRGIGFKYQAG